MTTIDCIACVNADDDGNCTLEVTTASFEDGCCDFAEKVGTGMSVFCDNDCEHCEWATCPKMEVDDVRKSD